MEKALKKIQSLQNPGRWAGNICFCLSLAMTIGAALLSRRHGIAHLAMPTCLSIGADFVSLGISTVLLYSLAKDRNMTNSYTGTYILLVTMVAVMIFTDVANWVVQGIPRLRDWNIIANVANYLSSNLLVFFFWQYVASQLELDGKLVKIMDRVLIIVLIPVLISILCNLFMPIYFTVDAQGVYHRSDLYDLNYLFYAVALIAAVIGFIISKATLKVKLILASFIMIPVAALVLTGDVYELTIEYSGFLVSVVLIFSVLVAERDKRFVSTEKELSIATNIQTDMLPNRFPAFPDRTEFDLFASMDPAKEVGGDFYDFFMIDDDRLAVVIADVSDKGVPAALFMMSAKIIINYCAQSGGTPGEILTEANAELSKKNKHKMFVTVWMGILELSTGMLTCTNAGHEYPVIRGQDGVFRVFRDKHGIPVAAMPKMKYRDYELRMEPGDAIFVYTDGVPEASNEKGDMYGMERLEETLNRLAGENPEGILRGIREDVDQFVKDAKQFDDLTMLCLEYRGRGDGI